MPLPSEIQAILNTTEEAGRFWLAAAGTATGDAVTTGAAEALEVLQAWRRRMTDLNRRWTSGGFSQIDFLRAAESEKEALLNTLAAIPNEKKKQWLNDLLGVSLEFLGRVLRAGAAVATRPRPN